MEDLLRGLSESRLIPSDRSYRQREARDIADIAHLYILSLRILLSDDKDKGWAAEYCKKACRDGNFRKWRHDANDLYALIHGLIMPVDLKAQDQSDRVLAKIALDVPFLILWLRGESHHIKQEPNTRKLLARLDSMLAITDPTFRSLRRLVMDWPTLALHEQRMVVTRLLQLLKHRAMNGDMYPKLKAMAERRELKLPDACDPETGAGCAAKDHDEPEKKRGFLASLANESASDGATSAANIAVVAGGLGAGFDGDFSKSIYGEPKAKAKRPTVLRR